MTLDEYIAELVEVLESACLIQPEHEVLQIAIYSNLKLMVGTDKILQKNLEEWPLAKVQIYGLRNIKYGQVNTALNELKNKSLDKITLAKAITAANELYESIKEENIENLKADDPDHVKEIIEKSLVPHLFILRYLKSKI